MKLGQWMVVFGYEPEKQADDVLECDDANFFIGTEQQCDEFFQEMMFDGSYPVVIKSQIVECAIKQGIRDEEDEGCT